MQTRNDQQAAWWCFEPIRCVIAWLARACGVCPGRDHGPDEERFAPRVVVRFKPGVFRGDGSQYIDDAERYFDGKDLEEWNQIREEFPGLKLRRAFRTLSPQRIIALVEEAQGKDRPKIIDCMPVQQAAAESQAPQGGIAAVPYRYDAASYFSHFFVKAPRERAKARALLARLRKWNMVSHAYVSQAAPRPGPVGKDGRTGTHVDAAPDGLGVVAAWGAGHDGAGITVADVERGWLMDKAPGVPGHTDLPTLGAALCGKPDQASSYDVEHGTAVLGVIAAQSNGQEVTGIAPKATLRVASSIVDFDEYGDPLLSVEDAITAAAAALNSGDVLLVEEQAVDWYTGINVPVERESGAFLAIRTAADKGIVVVEVAGNYDGGDPNSPLRDLDQLPPPDEYEDAEAWPPSGAIVVSAAASVAIGPPTFRCHRRRMDVNYGSIVDCYGLGDNVPSSGTDVHGRNPGPVTTVLSRTSAASAMIAGLIAQMQCIAVTTKGRRLDVDEVRALLRSSGTAVIGESGGPDPANQQGVMPDLQEIMTAIAALP